MYHMWYLYMLIGIYVMAPIVLRFKNSISERMFYRVSFVFLILASISRWTTSTVRLNWDIGQSFEYLGYFMIGYSIRKMCEKKSNTKALTAILGGLLIELCAAGLEYRQMMNGIKKPEYGIVMPYCPLIVLASVLIFYGVTVWNVNRSFAKCSGITFFIYLVHAGVWDFIGRVLNDGMKITILNGAIWIGVFVIIVFAISYGLSKVYLWIWSKVDKQKRATNFLLRMVRLQEEVC